MAAMPDPLERIAQLTYRKFHEVDATALKYDRTNAFSITGKFLGAADEYRADGFMAHALMSCRPATYSLFMIKNVLEEKVKVPGVAIEGDIVDLRVFNERKALDTMEAFIETMDHGRRERQRRGLGW
jgi:benzoyl-CoA reductase/2-hydroxyglutaryl-CoA dehydratase subunit BcrC/BadD/HgdB